MNQQFQEKIKILNDLYTKSASGIPLTEKEVNEQNLLREEFLNYFKFAISNRTKNM